MATTTTRTQGNTQANDALSVLLQQLLNGGTQSQQQQYAARQGEVNANTALRARYSPDAALADAQGLISQTLAQAMQSTIPSITRSAEGAGASGNALRALLVQDATTKAAQAASAQGVNAVQAYGGIGAQLSGVLEALTRPDNSNIEGILGIIQAMQEANQTTEADGGSSGGGGGVRMPTGGSGRSTDATDFFNRPGGILANAAQQRATAPVVIGPALSNSQILDTIQRGLGPSQPLSGVPNINSLYDSGFRL